VSISVPYDLRRAAESDDITKSINYGSLSKRVLASVVDSNPSASSSQQSGQFSSFRCVERLVDRVFATCFDAFPEIQRVALDVAKPRALTYADAVRVRSERARDGSRLAPDRFSIERLSCNVIVGLNQCEREDKQLVCFDVEVSTTVPPPTTSTTDATVEPKEDDAFDFRRLAKDIRQVRTFTFPEEKARP
jgi:dihydroneopterin aldolase/2-amino-4-hydroxy-6-hydroxymethyldihydropteridine diphosphokinase/dihydropteroate synthase